MNWESSVDNRPSCGRVHVVVYVEVEVGAARSR